MRMMEFLFGETTYFGLFLFLLACFATVRLAEAIAAWVWDKFGDWITGLFRQSTSWFTATHRR